MKMKLLKIEAILLEESEMFEGYWDCHSASEIGEIDLPEKPADSDVFEMLTHYGVNNNGLKCKHFNNEYGTILVSNSETDKPEYSIFFSKEHPGKGTTRSQSNA
jgi:hypothetical protein